MKETHPSSLVLEKVLRKYGEAFTSLMTFLMMKTQVDRNRLHYITAN